MATKYSRRNWLVLLLVAMLLGLGGLQIWSALATREVVQQALQTPVSGKGADLDLEKTRQEMIGKIIENRSKALLQTNLVSALGAGLGVILSVSGGLVALFGYLDARDKERIDRLESETKAREDRLQADDKGRRDRLATSLADTLGRVANADPRQRAMGVAGLLPFFTADRAEFHLQVMAALNTLSKSGDEPPDVRENVRVALEAAAPVVDPAILRRLSWRRAQLAHVNLSGCTLNRLDFGDADLRNAVLDGASLSAANLTAAKLQGARLEQADLSEANLTYADMAGASLKAARLGGAIIDNVGIQNVDFEGADLRGLKSGWRGAPWDASHNWRQALFDDDIRASLDKVYGAEIPPIRILMLLWEVPPFVAGGSWTAAYHLVRKLRRRGADITVVTPWRRDLLNDNPFGLDVPIVGLGVTPPRNAGPGGYGSYSTYYSPTAQGTYSTYASFGGPAVYGSYGLPGLIGSVLYILLEEYRSRLLAYLAEQSFDVVHAHDWVTFEAAHAAAEALGRDWVAHFHSLENDRNPSTPDLLTASIERAATRRARALVAPSEVTKRALGTVYGVPQDRVSVVPNSFTDGFAPAEEVGSFQARKVVFVGRLVEQKGFDRFVALAAAADDRLRGVRFEAFGEGARQSDAPSVYLRGALPWSRRGEAYREATAVVMPSRSEPFGMVVLEAMAHRVPVVFPSQSGAAEVLDAGVKIDGGDIAGLIEALAPLLTDSTAWERVVRSQAEAVERFAAEDHESRLVDIWLSAIHPTGVRA